MWRVYHDNVGRRVHYSAVISDHADLLLLGGPSDYGRRVWSAV